MKWVLFWVSFGHVWTGGYNEPGTNLFVKICVYRDESGFRTLRQFVDPDQACPPFVWTT